MKTKLFSLLFALVANTCALFAQALVDGNYYTYDEETHGMAFRRCYNSDVVNLTIPPYVDIEDKRYTVTKIEYQACSYYTNLKSVNLPSTIVAIEGIAFQHCSNLTAIQIPNGVKRIGMGAFASCSSLTSLTIPSSVTTIGDGAFGGCSGLKYIVIPENVTDLGISVFAGCTGIEQATVGSGLTSISYGTFRGCANLKNIIISNNITSIGEYAFYGCSSLPSITIEDNITEIGNYAFYDCENLETVTLVSKAIVSKDYEKYYNGCYSMFDLRVKKYVIAEGITHIGDYALYNREGMMSVVLPSSLSSIGEAAFSACKSLTSVTIPNEVTTIGNGAFSFCTNLESVSLGNSVIDIGNSAFSSCYKLSSIAIPNHVQTIGERAFGNCDTLSSVTFGNSVMSIGTLAFERCNIRNINFTGTVVEWCNKQCISALTCFAASDYTLSINGSKVEDLVIQEGVPYITANAFHHYTGLTSVRIPNSVDSIAEYAFYNCTELESIRCDAVIPPVWGNWAFENVDRSIPVYVPAESLDLYKTDWGRWSTFLNILPIDGVITALEEANTSSTSDPSARKIPRDGQVLILRGDKTYTLQGQEVSNP